MTCHDQIQILQHLSRNSKVCSTTQRFVELCWLSGGGFFRVYLTNGSIISSFAISASLFLIVVSSVFTGTALPFALARLGIDPANAGTSIQVQ